MKVNGTSAWSETEAGKQLQSRLNNEQTVKALDHLVARIGTLEQAVEKLATLMEQGPGLLSMAADTVDETYRRAKSRGIELEERLNNALHMAEQLTAPSTVAMVDQLMQLSQQAPGMISMTTDMIDEGYRRAAERGVDIDARLKAGLAMAEKLTAPEMVEQVNQLTDLAKQAPGLVAMVIDIVDEEARKAQESGTDLQVVSELGRKVLESASEARSMPTKKMNFWQQIRSFRDPDRQRAVSFLLNFTKRFGQKL